MDIRISEVRDPQSVQQAASLFDEPPEPAATERFLDSPTHHLLIAYGPKRQPLGMITGVEMTHPDKGTEMFLYELGVEPGAQGRGIGTQLVRALADLARKRGCYGMWVGTEPTNTATLRTYRASDASEEEPSVMLSWVF